MQIVIIILAVCAILLIIGIIINLIREKSDLPRHNRDGLDINQAELKSNSIIQSAMRQAHAMLVNAELSGIKEVVRTRHDTQQLEQAYDKHLAELINRSETHLVETTRSIEQHYIALFKNAEQHISQEIVNNQQRIINELDLAGEEARKLLTSQTNATHSQIEKQLTAEIQSAKEIIEAYKTKRIEAIDQQITELVIETVKRTLNKALNPDEHADLVIRSLQEAKEDGFFS